MLIGVIGCFLLLKRCNPENDEKIIKNSHTVQVVHDTIRGKDTIVQIETKVPGPTRTYTITIRDTFPCNHINVYTDTIRDSKVAVFVNDSINGTLLGRTLSYKLFVPLQINTTTTITDSISYPRPQSGLYLTGGVGFNSMSNSMFVGAMMVSKKKYLYGGSYDLLNKSILFHYGLRLR